MNHIISTLFLSTMLLAAACSVKSTNPPQLDRNGPPSQSDKSNWPSYKSSALSGIVFGKNWQSGSASFSTSLNDPEQIVLNVYGEKMEDACNSSAIPSLPMVTLHLPKDLKVQEYVTDLADSSSEMKSPLVFSTFFPQPNNIIADRTKIQIKDLSADGFKALLYAQGTDENNQPFEINGEIEVINCEKAVPFSFWKNLTGDYWAKSFDGKTVRSQYVSISSDTTSVMDPKTHKKIEMIELPLVYSMSDNSSASYSLGPIDGLGATISKVENGSKVSTYTYKGPLNFQGLDVNIDMEIKLTEFNSFYNLSYKLEIPGHIQKTAHTVEFTR